MDLTRVDTVVQFTAGSANVWNNVNVPVPIGAIVIDTVNKIVKEGDGVNLFANLPVCLDYNFTFATSGAITPVGANSGAIAIADDSLYSPGTAKLADIISMIDARTATNTPQDAQITTYSTNVIASVAQNTPDGTIVICSGGKYTPGNKTLTQLISDLIVQSTVYGSKMHIGDLAWYSDNNLKNPIDTQNSILENSTYYCKITGSHDTAEKKIIDFGLSTTQNGITITNSAKEETSALIVAVYGSTGNESFDAVGIDNDGNVICVGFTESEGSVGADALIVKFDNNLNILARKRYDNGSITLQSVTVDSNNNIICVGYRSEYIGSIVAGIIIKLNTNLNVLASKWYYYNTTNTFLFSAVTDLNNNIYVIGMAAEGAADYYTLIIKFDPNLNILVRKLYGGALEDGFRDVVIDSSGNIICVGWTMSEGSGNMDALIVKFDSSLNILAKKRYGSVNEDRFSEAVVDSSGNIYVSGWTRSEGVMNAEALLVKFDTNLNVLASKRCGGSIDDAFHAIRLDYAGNLICTGRIESGSFGSSDVLIVKFDGNLNIISKKRLGGTGDDRSTALAIDKNNNIYISGHTTSEGAGSYEALVIKLPSNIPTNIVSGTILTGLSLDDSNLTLSDSNLTLAVSNLVLSNSASIFADAILVTAESNLTYEREVLTAARSTTPTKMMTAIYSSSNDDKFNAAAKGASGIIFCVGYTAASGVEIPLIVKYDANFNVLARKLLNTGLYSGRFNDIIVGGSGNITAVGEFVITSGGAVEAFIIRMDIDLAGITNKKSLGAAGNDSFLKVRLEPVTNNFICVGYTTSEGTGLKDALIVKFDPTLTILYKKRYGGTGNEELSGITFDSAGNIICAGYTTSEGANTSGLILKLDSNLNIVLRKFYNSTLGTLTVFTDTVATAANVIYCVGRVTTTTGDKGLIVKMDTSLNVTGSKLYGNSIGSTEFSSVCLDSVNNIIAVGRTNAEGAGSYDALILKINSLFTILGRKTYGTFGSDGNIDCFIGNGDDIFISGYAVINNSVDAIVAEFPASLPAGLYTGKNISGLVFSDSQLLLTDDTATVNNSTLTMGDSGLVTSNRSFVVIDASGGTLSDTIILDAVPDVFKVQIGNIISSEASIPVSFNISTDDGNTVVNKTVNVNVQRANIITAIYGGAAQDDYLGVAIDSENNVYCAGLTYSEGNGSQGLIVKYDNNLNIVAKKVYGGTGNDMFNSVAIDSQDNVFVASYIGSGSSGISDAGVIKFDKDLNILIQRSAYGANSDSFSDITVDNDDNVICTGYSWSQGYGNADAIIVKFNNALNYVGQINVGGAQSEVFYALCTDSSNNIIAVGYTLTEGTGAPSYHAGIVYKYDKDLKLVARKVLYGSREIAAWNVTVDSDDNVYVVGGTKAEGTAGMPTYADAFIVKLNPMLELIAKKRYGTSGEDNIYSIRIDKYGKIICCGYVSDTANGVYKSLIMTIDSNLNVISKKKYGDAGTGCFRYVDVDSNGAVFCCGTTIVEGAGVNDCIVVKFPPSIPAGTFAGSVIDELVLSDETLMTVSGSNIEIANSTLNSVAGGLNINFISLTAANSNLTVKREVINL